MRRGFGLFTYIPLLNNSVGLRRTLALPPSLRLTLPLSGISTQEALPASAPLPTHFARFLKRSSCPLGAAAFPPRFVRQISIQHIFTVSVPASQPWNKVTSQLHHHHRNTTRIQLASGLEIMSDARRKASKGVKFEDTRSGSSRASTIGGSSTSSGHSGSQYTPEYNVGALEESLRATVRELDDWKKKALEADDILRKSEDASKARIKALEHQYKTLAESKDDLEKQFRDLKKENSKLQKKLEKYENQSEPSSPDSGKLRRSDSKKSKDPEGDRLKERFNRNSESPSEINPSKPPSSSRSKHSSSGRRLSVSSSERTPYLEGYGPGGSSAAPISHPASSSRRPPSAYITTNMPMPMPVSASTMQSPVFATPRSTAMPPMRPTVEYATYPHSHESYPIHQLPRR